MGRKFSLKSFFVALILLSLCLCSFVFSKSDSYKKSLDVLHSIVIPVEAVSDDSSEEAEVLPQESEDVLVEQMDNSDEVASSSELQDEPEAVEEEQVPSSSVSDDILNSPRAMISLIVYDYGLSSKFSEKIFETGVKNVSVAFSPYAKNVPDLVDMAYRFEGEPWVSVYVHKSSLENKDYGPLAILEGLNKEINDKRLSKALSQRSGSQGVVTFYDGRVSSKELSGVFKRVKQENLPMVLLSEVALFDEKDALHSSSVLDYNQDVSEVLSFLDAVKTRALVSGQAIAAVPPTPLVLEELSRWERDLRQESIHLVPLSVLLER